VWVEGVHPYVVTFGIHPPQQIRTIRRAGADNEEGRFHPVSSQNVQDFLGPFRGAVIKRQNDVAVSNPATGRFRMSHVDNGAASPNGLRHLSGLRLGGRIMDTFANLAVDESREQQEEQ
jgi:hypothetical protein